MWGSLCVCGARVVLENFQNLKQFMSTREIRSDRVGMANYGAIMSIKLLGGAVRRSWVGQYSREICFSSLLCALSGCPRQKIST